MLKRLAFLIQLLFISSTCLFVQSQKPPMLELQSLAAKLYQDHSDLVKYEANGRVETLIIALANQTNAEVASIDTLTFLKSLIPDDETFRIVTWAFPLSGNLFHYSGFLQVFGDTGTQDTLIRFEYKIGHNELYNSYPAKQWTGAVYYKLIEKISRQGKLYTLLGWVGAEEGVEKRVIEIIDFDRDGLLVFGKPVFAIDSKKNQSRVIFEYTDEVPFHLNYEKHPMPGKKIKKEWMIVFNRLRGNNPQMGRMYKARVPDYSTFDGLIFTEGKWLLYRDLDLRVNTPNGKDKSQKTKFK